MSPVSASSTVNLLDNQEPKSSSQESLTLQRRTTNVSTTLPRNKPNFFTNALRRIKPKTQHVDIIQEINKKILKLCDTSYLENTSKEIIDQKMTTVEQLLYKLSYEKMQSWFSSDISKIHTESYFSFAVRVNIQLAEKIFSIINSQKTYDIINLLEQSDYSRHSNFMALIILYFESDIKFADLKLEQIFIKYPELLYKIHIYSDPYKYKDATQKLLNIIDIAIKKEKISDNTRLAHRFYNYFFHVLKNKDYSNIKKMLEYNHHFPLIRDHIETIVTINDAKILKLFAKYKLPLYVENIYQDKCHYIVNAILPALSYAILTEKDDAASAIIKLGTNLNETEAYYKLGYSHDGEVQQEYLADISYNASDNDEYTKETFLPPLFYAIFLRNHQIIDQLLAAGANKGYALEYIYNELEKDLRKPSKFIKEILLDLRKDTSYNEEITAKLQQASILSNE